MLWRTACFVTASALVLLLAHRVGRLQARPRPASSAAEKSQVGPDMGSHDKARAGSVRMDQVVLFGDSITQGSWVPGGTGAALAHVYQRKLDVMNRGFSGYNTEWGLQVLRRFLPRYDEELPKIALFCVWFGANDAALPPSPQALTLAEFKTNLNKILDLLRSPKSPNYSPDTQLLLITPPPVDASKRTADLAQRDPPRSPDRDASRTRQFAEAVKEVAHESNLPVLDAWSLIDSAARNDGGLDKYLNDGLHLTAAGYGVVTAGLFALIESDLPQLHWSRLGQVFPHWTDFIAPELRS